MIGKRYLAWHSIDRRDQVLLYEPQTQGFAVVSVNARNIERLANNPYVQLVDELPRHGSRAGRTNAYRAGKGI